MKNFSHYQHSLFQSLRQNTLIMSQYDNDPDHSNGLKLKGTTVYVKFYNDSPDPNANIVRIAISENLNMIELGAYCEILLSVLTSSIFEQNQYKKNLASQSLIFIEDIPHVLMLLANDIKKDYANHLEEVKNRIYDLRMLIDMRGAGY